jgi:hypothetical protein
MTTAPSFLVLALDSDVARHHRIRVEVLEAEIARLRDKMLAYEGSSRRADLLVAMVLRTAAGLFETAIRELARELAVEQATLAEGEPNRGGDCR